MTSQDFIEEDDSLSRDTAFRLVEKNFCTVQEFIAENGDHERYDTKKTLIWLGF
jgi:hypothetical protein